jgi:hypothetical protein
MSERGHALPASTLQSRFCCRAGPEDEPGDGEIAGSAGLRLEEGLRTRSSCWTDEGEVLGVVRAGLGSADEDVGQCPVSI